MFDYISKLTPDVFKKDQSALNIDKKLNETLTKIGEKLKTLDPIKNKDQVDKLNNYKSELDKIKNKIEELKK